MPEHALQGLHIRASLHCQRCGSVAKVMRSDRRWNAGGILGALELSLIRPSMPQKSAPWCREQQIVRALACDLFSHEVIKEFGILDFVKVNEATLVPRIAPLTQATRHRSTLTPHDGTATDAIWSPLLGIS